MVENCCGREHIVNHLAVPAACFTHPEVSFVGLTEDAAREEASKKGFEVAVAKTSFKVTKESPQKNECKHPGQESCVVSGQFKGIGRAGE